MTQLGTKKSRRGCTQCKRRRVKCDENTPCANCVRRSEQCSLLYPTSPSNGSEATLPTDSEEWLQDLELMHHYSHKTCRSSLGSGTRIQYLWSEHIPLEAVKHPFLMHGVLALAALHLASTRPQDACKYARLCDKHQATALAAYRTVLTHVTDDVCNALFALSTVLSVSSLARATLKASRMPGQKYMTVADITELFFMTRGVREVVQVAHHVVSRGPFSVMLYGHGLTADVKVTLSPKFHEVFADLSRMVRNYCMETENLTTCARAVEELRSVYERAVYFYDSRKLEMGHIWSWVAQNSYDFIKLVQNSYPPALAITAHFCAATMLMQETWYIANWGRFAFDGILIALDGQLGDCLSWARGQIATDLVDFKHDAATISRVEDHARQEHAEGSNWPTPDPGTQPEQYVAQWSTPDACSSLAPELRSETGTPGVSSVLPGQTPTGPAS